MCFPGDAGNLKLDSRVANCKGYAKTGERQMAEINQPQGRADVAAVPTVQLPCSRYCINEVRYRLEGGDGACPVEEAPPR